MRIVKILFFYFRQRYFLKFKTREAILAYQERKIAKHLTWVKKHSPFYKNNILSIVDKKTLMANFDTWNTAGIHLAQAETLAIEAEKTRNFSPSIGSYTVGLSSGTSGHRGIFLAHPDEIALYAGTILAKALRKGLGAKARIALFLRANSNLYEGVKNGRVQFRFFDLLRPIDDSAIELGAFKPTLLIAPPSVLRKLAELQNQKQLQISPEVIYSTAEVLDPLDEKYIAQAIGTPVHQIYQATEGFLGISCTYGTLHLNEDLIRFEKEDLGDGRFSPILTDFNRKTQPIIRYRLNDILLERKTPCPCGSSLIAIEKIEGRMDDCLIFQSTSGLPIEILPDFIRRCILFAEGTLEDYAVTQSLDGNLKIALRLGSAKKIDTEDSIRKEFKKLENDFRVKIPAIEFTSEFPYFNETAKKRRIYRTGSS